MTGAHAFAPLDGPAPVADEAAAAAALAQEQQRAEREAAIALVRRQLAASLPVPGTLAERYLTSHRHLRGPWPDSLRFADAYRSSVQSPARPCLLAAVTDASGATVALQAIELDPHTGGKSIHASRPKRSHGPVGEGAVFLGDADEHPPVLVIGEGVETTLSCRLVGPCDACACLGALRWIAPAKHHKRVEVLADNDGRDKARQLARRYAEHGLAAYVVTVPDALGPKADLNDLLRELGANAVQLAVEDAERIEPPSAGRQRSEYALAIGSDIEIAQLTLDKLEDLFGPIVVDEGRAWRFDRTHWVAIDDDQLARLIHKADGTVYDDADGKPRTVRLNKSRVASITDAMLKYRRQPDYFASAPVGLNCEAGFIRINAEGDAELLPHGRRWRQRHVVRGRWPCRVPQAERERSRLAGYLRTTFHGDPDGPEKIALLGELFGCAATGYGTRLRSPKAVVLFSEQGATGKSALLHLLRALPNPEAVASVPPGKFGDEKYAHRLIGKVLNAADELPDRAVRSDVFKRMITGEPVPARDLFKSATDFRPIALHVFTTNVLPSFSGGIDGGVVRRLLPVAFNRVVPEAERDPALPVRILAEEADLLLDLAVEGAKRLIRQGDFTVPASSKELLERWTTWADPVRAWAAERIEVTAYENVIAVAALYRDFAAWAEQRGFNPELLPNVIAFGKRLHTARPELECQRSDGSWIRNARLCPTSTDGAGA